MQTNITLELIPTQNYAIGFYILFIGESFWNMLSKIININDHEIISVLVSCFLNLLVILVLVFRRRNIFVFANSHNISTSLFNENFKLFLLFKFLLREFSELKCFSQEDDSLWCVYNSSCNLRYYVFIVNTSHAHSHKFWSQFLLNI